MKNPILPNNWNLQMKDGTTPILAGLKQQIDNWKLGTHLQKRDRSPALAAQLYDVH